MALFTTALGVRSSLVNVVNVVVLTAYGGVLWGAELQVQVQGFILLLLLFYMK
jgi:hypothetical protein